MTYQSVVVMAGNQTLRARVVAAAADAGLEDPLSFVDRNMWHIVSYDGFAEAWDFATNNYNRNFNPDTGMRDDVINDDMIAASVAARLADVTDRPGHSNPPVNPPANTHTDPVTTDPVTTDPVTTDPTVPGAPGLARDPDLIA